MSNPGTVVANVIHGDASFCMAVPTCTIILTRPDNPYEVAVIEQSEKHNGRFTLVGGKLTGDFTPEMCAEEEFDQEVGGKAAKLISPTRLTVKTDRMADPRVVSLKKATDGLCPDTLAGLKVLALYGVPDYIFVGTVEGELAPKDGEAKRVEWIDVRNVKVTATAAESIFGAQHDLLLIAYCRHLQGTPIDPLALSDLAAYREALLREAVG